MGSQALNAIVTLIVAVLGGGGAAGWATARARRKQIDTDSDVTLSKDAREWARQADQRAAVAEQKLTDALQLMDRLRRRQIRYDAWALAMRVWAQEAADDVNSRGGHLRPAPRLIEAQDD